MVVDNNFNIINKMQELLIEDPDETEAMTEKNKADRITMREKLAQNMDFIKEMEKKDIE